MYWLKDLVTGCEVWVIGTGLLWFLPKLMFPELPGRNYFLRFFGRICRMLLLSLAATLLLAFLHILNAFTLTCFYILVTFALRLRHTKLRYQTREWLFRSVASLEEWYRQLRWTEQIRVKRQVLLSPSSVRMIPVLGVIVVVLVLIAEVRLWLPIHELRFGQPGSYMQLMRVRELLHDIHPFARPLLLPSLLTVVSSLSGIDAMQVTRFLPSLLDILVAIGGGVAMAAVFRSVWVGVFTSFLLGCYVEKSVVDPTTLGTYSLLLGVAFISDYCFRSHSASLVDALCAFTLFFLSLPDSFPREIVLTLLICCLFGVIARLLQRHSFTGHTEAFVSSFLMAGLFAVSPPKAPHPVFLEYDATARQSLLIAETFPRERWAVAAPSEQFTEILGLGQYEDLNQFVGKYHAQVRDADFQFPYRTLFVFVEKHPFEYFAAEPGVVSFQTLTDPTYRNYRSPAGRSSLELAALELCEIYRKTHPTRIFYEDENLRIYQFGLEKPSELSLSTRY